MARSRNIKPGFFQNEQLANFPAMTRLLFAGLWTIADKAGRLEDRPRRIKAALFPYEDITGEEVEGMLSALASGPDPFIVRYVVESCPLIQVVNWERHQSPYHREKESILPPIEEGSPAKAVQKPCLGRAEARIEGNQESGIRNQSKGDARGKFIPPTVAEVAAYCSERANGIDAEEFVAHYAANGWRRGKTPIKSWRDCVVTWEKKRARDRPPPLASRLPTPEEDAAWTP